MRIPELLEVPISHKGIMTAPLIEQVDIERYLETGKTEQVIYSKENCGSQFICNGCGRCAGGDVTLMEMEDHDRN